VGTLFLVATPIGNLEDLSLRAIKILQQVQLIAAEDTRRTRTLLEHYHITTPSISYHEHNKISRLDEILTALMQGDVALVSDAGTPGLNDPGYELVGAALSSGHAVSPIPGASAPIAALVVSGLPTNAFLYLGYLPRKVGEQQRLLKRYADFEHTLIFLESPHRLVQSLKSILKILGDRRIAVGRELTKLHEEIFRGRLSLAIEHFSETGVRGEITLIIEGSGSKPNLNEDDVHEVLSNLLKDGISSSEAASQASALTGWPRRQLYQMIMDSQKEKD